MKISYTENGQTKTIELKEGEQWSKFKNSSTLNSLFAKIDNGNGKIDAVEIDALFREMHVVNTDGKVNHLSQNEQERLKALNWQSIKNKVQVAENIYNDVNETNFGIPTTGKNIRSHVYAINTSNATTVCKTFSEKTNGKKTIIGEILTEYGLDFSERAEYIKHIVSTLAKDFKSQGKNVDDIAQKIYAELEKQRKKIGPATSTEINKLFNQMLNAPQGRTVRAGSTGSTGNSSSNSSNNVSIINSSNKLPIKKYSGRTIEFSYWVDKYNIKSMTLTVGNSIPKTGNSKLDSVLAKLTDGNGNFCDLGLDALFREMKAFNTEYSAYTLSTSEINKLSELNWTNIINKVQVAEDIYDDINAKTKVGLDTTGKNIGKHIYSVSTANATTVCKTYSEKTNGEKTIVGAIMSEHGLRIEDRVSYAKHVARMLALDYKSQGKNVDDLLKKLNDEIDAQAEKFGFVDATKIDKIFTEMLNARKGRTSSISSPEDPNKDYYTPVKGLNGKIDKDFSQGNTGDCWLLASIKALSMSPKGLHILNDSVTIQKDGNVRVHLKGVDATYIFSPSEIQGRTDLSTGDLDIRAIEMAVEKYLKANPMRGKDTLNGNKEWVAYYLLTGKGDKNFLSDSYGRILDSWWFSDRQIKNFNKPNHIACVARTYGSDEDIEFRDKKGDVQSLHARHAYSVVGSDQSYVYLINPWDSSEILSVPIPVFKSFFNAIDEFDL